MKVAIVGLGFSGLRAAMLLESAGVDVVLLEARERPGGRCFTHEPSDGVRYEAGGEWIDSDHYRVLNLLSEFKLKPIGNAEWPQRVIYRGKQTTEAELWSDALEDELRLDSVAKELCRELKIPAWKNKNRREWDQQKLSDFVALHVETPRGKWWVNAKLRSDEGDDLERIGLLGWLAGYQHYVNREPDVMSSFRFPGGASNLISKMIQSLKAKPRYNFVLQRIHQTPTGLVLESEGSKVKIDKVIITLPPPAVERVIFDPPLPPTKRCTIEACQMSRAIKISWQFSEFWWKKIQWGGSMLCDGTLQQTWDGTLGDEPILSAYICGADAKRYLEHSNPVREALHELQFIYPEAAKYFVHGWIHDWIRDPYSLGAFSHLAPGYVLEHLEYMHQPAGNIHFAGEHTASWTGFIEGALESAERVTQEIINGK